jgi:hypothetical protein
MEVKQKMVSSMVSGAVQWKSDQTTIQLVSEPLRSLVVLNMLCDPKATWRKALSSLRFSMVKISIIERAEQ